MIYGSVYGSIHESTLDVAPYEFDESMSFQEMGAQMIEEATNDWNNYMQAIALTELSYVIETGQEYLYEGVDISAMIDKVKEWFKKIWAKIQGIAKAAMAKFAQFAVSDQKFLDKYESDIYDGARKIPNGFSYKGYKFDNLDKKSTIVKTNSDSVISDADKALDRMRTGHASGADYKTSGADGKEENSSKQLDEALDKYRGAISEKTGKVSASEFKKAVKISLYGSADKEYIKTVDASKLVGIIKGAQEAKDNAKDAESSIKEDIDKKIEALDNLESEIRDIDTKPENADNRDHHQGWASMVNRYSGFLKSVETVNAQWFSMYLTALKDQNRQAKAVCTKLISYANGIGAKKESAGIAGSLLEDRFAALDF